MKALGNIARKRGVTMSLQQSYLKKLVVLCVLISCYGACAGQDINSGSVQDALTKLKDRCLSSRQSTDSDEEILKQLREYLDGGEKPEILKDKLSSLKLPMEAAIKNKDEETISLVEKELWQNRSAEGFGEKLYVRTLDTMLSKQRKQHCSLFLQLCQNCLA